MGAPKPGLLIPVDGMPKLVSVDGLESMQALVGGDIECVGDAFGPGVDAWVNAESLILGMPPNLAHPLDTAANEGPCTEVLCGPVLVLGLDDDGETVGLTAENMARMWPGPWSPNAWAGTTVESQEWASKRLPWLLEVPAAVHFVSYEPALGLVDFARVRIPGVEDPLLTLDALTGLVRGPDDMAPGHVDWIICGSESGPGARPMPEEWVRSVRDQCAAAGTAFFYKQRKVGRKVVSLPMLDGKQHREWPR